VYCVSRAYHMMPFTVDDVSRSEAEIAASEAKDIQTAHKRVGQDTRLDNRCIDLRAPAQNAIMRINSGVCDLWREACKVRLRERCEPRRMHVAFGLHVTCDAPSRPTASSRSTRRR